MEIISKDGNKDLFKNLIWQINKDLKLSGISDQIAVNTSTENFMEQLYEVVYHLIESDDQKLLNLMYRVDVSEKKYVSIQEENIKTQTEQLALLILEKECQKVHFKNRN